MKTGRLEAFSDGVIAVIITIMVLELKAPHTGTLEALLAVAPSLSIYGMSFAVVAIMWVNHHHLFEKAKGADASLLWSNNLLLFWMSLIPFVTAYLGENCHEPLALCVYGGIMALASTGFLLLQTALDRQAPEDSARQAEFRKNEAQSLLLCTLLRRRGFPGVLFDRCFVCSVRDYSAALFLAGAQKRVRGSRAERDWLNRRG